MNSSLLGAETREELGLPRVPVPPERALEARLAGAFSDHFEVGEVGVTDSFFILGGDSLGATTLMAAIETLSGVTLPVSVLLEAPTPRQLARVILGHDWASLLGGQCLCPFRKEGEGPPVFVVHGTGGDVFFARTLALEMGPGRPVYGVRARGLLTGERPPATVPGMARDYLREIRAEQPKGPYLLLGHCGGSIVAYEMAQQLIAAGEEVAGLVLIDHETYHRVAPWLYGRSLWTVEAQLHALVRRLRVWSAWASKRDSSGQARRRLVRMAIKAAIATYRPSNYRGTTLLIVSKERRAQLLGVSRGFPRLVPDLTIAEAAESHEGIFFGQPLQTVARVVAEFFQRVAPIQQRADGAARGVG